MSVRSEKLLPVSEWLGPRVPYFALIAITSVETIRSLIHMLALDGGASSIAGIPLAGPAGSNIVAMFGQWGASQLVLALISWAVIVRCRSLVALMWLAITIEQCLRYFEGHFEKPITSTHTPPGEYGTYATLALAMLMLAWSLIGSASNDQQKRGSTHAITGNDWDSGYFLWTGARDTRGSTDCRR